MAPEDMEVKLTLEQVRRLSAEAFEAGIASERARLLEVVEDDTHPIWFGALQDSFIGLVKGEYKA
jgi:hypothetical protein